MRRFMLLAATVGFGGAVGVTGFGSVAFAHPWDQSRPTPIQPVREGHPPSGFIRGDIMVRVAQDGRGETAVEAGHATSLRPSQIDNTRPDRNLGQASHFALPIRNDVKLRVSGGGDREGGALTMRTQISTERDARVYPGRYERLPSPLPIKHEVLQKLEGMQNAGVDDVTQNALTRSRDGQASRLGDHGTHMSTKVYPGREEHPSVPEMFMKYSKHKSATGDQPGDKDAG